MKATSRTIGLLALLPLLAITPAHAQGFLGGLLGKEAAGAPEAKVDADAIFVRGAGILLCLALANDRALAAQEKMLAAFPEEKLAEIRKKYEKYNEAKAKRMKETSPDATQLGPENDAAAECQKEVARVVGEGVTFKAGYGKEASAAYKQVGWAIGIDLLAVLQLPGFVKEAQTLVKSLSSNPFQITKIKAAGALALTIGGAIKLLPSQVDALKTVRAVAKQIAEAEKVTLEEPKAVTELNPKQLTEGQGESVAG